MTTKFIGHTLTEANADLDNLPQITQKLAPAVANQAARDALFPVPVANARVQRLDNGYQERYDGSEWLKEGVTRAAGPIVSAHSQGAKGDGVTDDHAAFVKMDALVAAHGRAEADPALDANGNQAAFLIGSNLTLVSHYKPGRGAILRPAAGVNIAIGPLEAGDYQIFDRSLGGIITLANAQKVNPLWFGVKGDNVADDQPALTFMDTSIQNYAHVEFPGALTMRLASTWTTTARRGIHYRSRVLPFPDGTLSTKFTWDGAAPGTIRKLSSCDNCIMEGFYYDLGSRGASNVYATVGLDLDDSGINGVTGTHCSVIYSIFNATSTPLGTIFDCIRIAATSGNNHEYHRLWKLYLFGNGSTWGPTQGVYATINAGSLSTLNITGGGDPIVIGRTYHVQVAGALGGSVLDTNVTMTTATQGTLAVAATTAVAGALVLLGDRFGRGINNGPSSNAKGQDIRWVDFLNLHRGYYQQNGSATLTRSNFGGCDVNIELIAGSESFEDNTANCEQSGQHLITNLGGWGFPIMIRGGRFGNLHCAPNKGWISVTGGASVLVESCEFDDKPSEGSRGSVPTGSTAYDFANFSGAFEAFGNRYANTWTAQEVGYLDASGLPIRGDQIQIVSRGETYTGKLGTTQLLGSTFFVSDSDAAVTAMFEVRTGGGGGGKFVASRSKAIRGANGNIGDLLVGHQVTIGRDPGGRFDHNYRLLEVLFPTLDTGGTSAQSMHGIHVVAPDFSASSGGSNPASAVVIEDLQTHPGNLGTTQAIQQQGPNDDNLLAGPTRYKKKVRRAAVGGGGTVVATPGTELVLRISASGNFTITPPTAAECQEGTPYTLDILNTSAGAIVITFALGATAFLGGFTAPAAGKRRIQRYIGELSTLSWVPDGPQTGDI